jgi:23S rRNA (cytosine1962-C5)-methyltransferase
VATVTLHKDKERPVQQRHPWIFSGAVADVKGFVGKGDVVDVHSASGDWLARGTWGANSQIRVRLHTWDPSEPLDADLFRGRLTRAVQSRANLPGYAPEDARRLVFAESDGLPGIIVDQFGEYLVVQLLTQGAAVRADLIATTLQELVGPRGMIERGDSEIREKEGLPPAEGLLRGEPPPERVVIRQGTVRYAVDLSGGQKSGFYLDQAINRRRVAAYCGAEVLDAFCYTGGFTIHAAQAGASQITALDSSEPALELLRVNLELNAVSTPVEIVAADVFKQLRQYRLEGRQFDTIILDPPKFAYSGGQIERATRGYKDINLIAMQLLRPGGILATFSCSGLVSPDLFQKVVFGASVDAKRDVQVLERLSQAPDHPLLLTFPEGEYLKGLICRVH